MPTALSMRCTTGVTQIPVRLVFLYKIN